MSKELKKNDAEVLVPEKDFLNIFGAIINNYTQAASLNEAGDDAMSTSEILEIMRDINPFIPVSMVVMHMEKMGFKYQFDLRSREIKWLMKFVEADH